NDRPSLFLSLHRLHTAGEVDDSKTAMPQTGMPIDPGATSVRTAARHRFCHRGDDVLVCREIAVVANPARDAAHRVTLSTVFIGRYVRLLAWRWCGRVTGKFQPSGNPITSVMAP